MAVWLMLEQGISLFEGFDDDWIGILQYVETGKGPGFVGEGARFVDRTKHG